MGTRGLIACGALLLTALVAAVHPARAEPEPFQAMRAVRVMPPVAVPDVRFQELDGRRVGLDSFRGRPILLTFFTTW